MVNLSRSIICTTLFIFTGSLTFAETDLHITGQIRVRHETDKKGFASSAGTIEYTNLRTRVMLEAVVDGNTHAVVQFQDSRRFGASGASGNLDNRKNVDLHQGYIHIDRLWAEGWGVQAGRFELNLGNQRVFGAVGWHNVGRAWDGFQGWYDHPRIKITGYWLKRIEYPASFSDRDFDIFGSYVSLKRHALDIFAFYEYNGEHVPPLWNRLDRVSAGLYHRRHIRQFDLEINGVYQFGSQPIRFGTDLVEQDIFATMFAFEVGYLVPGAAQARLATGIDYTSGDDDLSDDTFGAYDNLYYTAHKFRGYMDYFTGSDTRGLVNFILRGHATPAPGWLINGDLHYFQSAVEFLDFNNQRTRRLGTELDLGLSTDRITGAQLAAGVSVFLPTEAFAERKDPEPGFWSYVMAIVDF